MRNSERPREEKVDSAVRAGSNAKQDFPYFTPGGFIDARQWDGLMPLSIEELRGKVEDYRKKGLNTQQLSLIHI